VVLYPLYAVLTGIVSLVYPMIGAIIVSRLPANPIGWIFCIVGLLYQVQHFALAYANYAVAKNFALPWGEYVAWSSTWVGFAGLILVGASLMLLFPDGRLLSRWWQIAAWCGATRRTVCSTRWSKWQPKGLLPARFAVQALTNCSSPPREKTSTLARILWRVPCSGSPWAWLGFRFGSSPDERSRLFR
jgi:hypothetical protein